MTKNIMPQVAAVLLLLASCNFHNGKAKDNFQGNENAVWTEAIYFRGERPSTKELLTENDIRNYAQTMKSHSIKYAYIFSGPIGKDGHLPSFAYSGTAKSSIRKLKELYPELKILPWIGGIQNKTVYLNDSNWVNTAIGDIKRMVDTLGVEGVHVDFEYVVPSEIPIDSAVEVKDKTDMDAYPIYVNSFHEKLRKILPKKFISAVLTSTPPETRHWKRKTSLAEIEGLLPNIDQLVFLFYDTDIHDKNLFAEATKHMLEDISHLKAKKEIPYLLAIGTFTNPAHLQSFHDLQIENIPNTLNTIKQEAQALAPGKKLIDGISIFCDWETGTDEWQEISDNWSNRNNQ